MKKQLIALALVLCSCLDAFSQATSLTIDCQTPGWLASYINPTDVQNIRSLTVTGIINITDLATIGNLVKNYQLKERLDLENVDIEGNMLSGEMFGVTDCQLRYLSLPLSVTKLENCVNWVKLDTLVCGSEILPIFDRSGYLPIIDAKHLILREGVTNYMYNEEESPIEEIVFPNSLKYIYELHGNNLSKINIPPAVEHLGSIIGTKLNLNGDTLYIPNTVECLYDGWGTGGYKNGYLGYNKRDVEGRIKCMYLPERLATLWVQELYGYSGNQGKDPGTMVDIHIKAKTPPKIENGTLGSNTKVYVPVGYADIYKATGYLYGGSGYTQWGGATILEEIYAERIDISSPEILYVGDSKLLKVEFIPSNTTFKDVSWEVSDSEVLSITKDGTCNALCYGEVQATAINADHSCTDTKTIKVYNHTTGITISEKSLNILIGEKVSLEATTLPLTTSDGRITWSSDDELVATVDGSGNVRGIGRGTCTITATTVDGGYKAECVVAVTQQVEALTLEKHSMSLIVGEAESLYAQVTPATADNKAVVWFSSDDRLATVNKNGDIIAVKAGTVCIKAVSEDNEEAKDSCKVTILQPVTGIELNHEDYRFEGIGKSFELVATVLPEDASNKNVKWTSSNPSVCTVTASGKIVAMGYGDAVIMAVTNDGEIPAICVVKVARPKYKLTYILDGEEYKSYEVEWTSSITPEAAPTKEGYDFSGWSQVPATMPEHDVTITGSFIVKKYKLIYKVDNEEYNSYEVEYGANITAEAAPTKEGYEFSGWSQVPATMPEHDVTITGSFIVKKYKLIYKVDNEEYNSYEVEYGTNITAEAEPKKEGYEFSGWSTIPTTMPAKDVTITGSFTLIDAIEDVITDDGIYHIYTLDGKQVETLQKGVNIIKYRNGSTQKIFVK